MKSPSMLPPIKHPIPNQYSNIIITRQDKILPKWLEKWPTGHKPFIDDTHFSNKTEHKHNYSTDNSCTENEDYVNKTNIDKDEDKYD